MDHVTKSDFSDCKGIWIPATVFFNRDLSRLERDLIVDIFYLESDERGCFKSNASFAEFHGVGISAIVKALTHLRKLGWIEDECFDGRVRTLRVNREKYFGVGSIGKNSHGGYAESPTHPEKSFPRREDEKAPQDIEGKQHSLPRSGAKVPIQNTKKKGAPSARVLGGGGDAPSGQNSAPGARVSAYSKLPRSLMKKTPAEQEAVTFAQGWKEWYINIFDTSATISPSDVKKVASYFELNPERDSEYLLARALGCWMVKSPEKLGGKDGHDPAWHCRNKSSTVTDFIQNISKIEEQLDNVSGNWTEDTPSKVIATAIRRFSPEP